MMKYDRCILVPASAQTLSNHTATRGRNGVLNCQTGGDPEPSISWLRNGSQLINGTKYTILENGSLWIRNIEDSDAGNYSCHAVNIAGTQMAATTLVIYGETLQTCVHHHDNSCWTKIQGLQKLSFSIDRNCLHVCIYTNKSSFIVDVKQPLTFQYCISLNVLF